MTKPLAFLSHSSEDKILAQELTLELRARGVEVWIDDEQIGFGDSIPGKISDGLQHADVILLLVSPSFLASSWCRAEYEPLMAQEIQSGRTTVIPLRLNRCEMPALLQGKRYLDVEKSQRFRKFDLDDLAKQIVLRS